VAACSLVEVVPGFEKKLKTTDRLDSSGNDPCMTCWLESDEEDKPKSTSGQKFSLWLTVMLNEDLIQNSRHNNHNPEDGHTAGAENTGSVKAFHSSSTSHCFESPVIFTSTFGFWPISTGTDCRHRAESIESNNQF
jgi:hypothetical protein